MFKYYQETKTKDFLVVDTTSRAYYKRIGKRELEGRAVALEGNPASMCTTGISTDYLKNRCKRVTVNKIPASYIRYFGIEEAI